MFEQDTKLEESVGENGNGNGSLFTIVTKKFAGDPEIEKLVVFRLEPPVDIRAGCIIGDRKIPAIPVKTDNQQMFGMLIGIGKEGVKFSFESEGSISPRVELIEVTNENEPEFYEFPGMPRFSLS